VVIGIDDDRLGQIVGAVLVLNEQASPETIETDLDSAGISVDRWVTTDAVARNAMGKPERTTLLNLLNA